MENNPISSIISIIFSSLTLIVSIMAIISARKSSKETNRISQETMKTQQQIGTIQNKATLRNQLTTARVLITNTAEKLIEKKCEYNKNNTKENEIAWAVATENYLNAYESACELYWADYMTEDDKNSFKNEYKNEIKNLINNYNNSCEFYSVLTEEYYPNLWKIYKEWFNQE